MPGCMPTATPDAADPPLTLTNFRNYHAASLETGAATDGAGRANGAGKTNLIEAISFLAPGRGLRRATLDEVAFSEGDGSWAVAAEIEGALGLATLGTGIERPPEEARRQRKCRIDREPVGLGRRVRRSSARGLAGAGDGRAVHRRAVRAPAFSRSSGARGRRRACQPRQRARSFAALAQPAVGGAAAGSALARCRRTRNRGTRGRGGGAARGNRAPA